MKKFNDPFLVDSLYKGDDNTPLMIMKKEIFPPEDEDEEEDNSNMVVLETPQAYQTMVKDELVSDPFDLVIGTLAKGQTLPVQQAINDTECFARCWFDADEQTFCHLKECGLKTLCELCFFRAIESPDLSEEQRKEIIGDNPQLSEHIASLVGQKMLVQNVSKKRGLIVVKRKKSPRRRRKCTDGRYKRSPYINMGRPIDILADILWKGFGKPPIMTKNFQYGDPAQKGNIEAARFHFIRRYGDGLMLTRSVQYHQFFFKGEHLLRLWVNAASGGWLDVNPYITECLRSQNKLDLERPTNGRDTKYKFLPYRTYVTKIIQIKDMLKSLSDFPELKDHLDFSIFTKKEKIDGQID